MAGNTKQRSAELLSAALAITDTVALDQIEDMEARRQELRRLALVIVDQTGCTIESARRKIAQANRIKRHPNYEGAGGYIATGWGGKRPGAGRPTNEIEE